MVRRAMNRAPGPSDFWWSDHQASCGGTYVKVREPEGYSANKKGKGGKTSNGKGGTASSKTEFPALKAPKKIEKPAGSGISGGEVNPKSKSGIYGYFIPSKPSGDQKTPSPVGGLLDKKSPQVSTLVVPKGSKPSEVNTASASKPFVPFSGKGQVLGGGSSIQRPTLPKQHLPSGTKGLPSAQKDPLKRSIGTHDNVSPVKRPRETKLPPVIDSGASSSKSPVRSFPSHGQQVKCPVCNSLQDEATINAHLDDCIASQSKSMDDDIICLDPPSPVKGSVESWYLECPGCRDKVKESEFDQHLNSCERICGGGEQAHDSQNQEDNSGHSSDDDVIECPSCPICGQSLSSSALGAHLDTCLSSMSFDDDEEEWS